MPIIGNRKSTATMGKGYSHDAIYSFAEAFKETAKDILAEGVDLFLEPHKALQMGATRNALKNFYVEGCCDENEYVATGDPEGLEETQEMYSEMFLNDVEAIQENTALGAINPVIGITFPLHKNIMMNNVFDKGAIPKFVAREPKFTISMETRILKTPAGEEIDMYKEQYKMRDAIANTAPFTEVELALPQAEGATNILTSIGATTGDNLSIESYISAIHLKNVPLKKDDINPETGEAVAANGKVSFWLPVRLRFTPAYGKIDRVIAEEVEIKARTADYTADQVYKSAITGYMRDNKVMLNTSTPDSAGGTTFAIDKVKLNARIDTSSAMLQTCSVAWKVNTDIVEIGSAIPINTTVSPEEVKDVGALYNVNQLSKVLSLMKTALGEYKDSTIKKELDTSFTTMPAENKFATTFDFAPRQGYALDHVEWRYKTFMDFLDSVVTGLLQVLNDPNMTVSIFGSPELIRKVTPTEYTYQTPSNIGPVALDYVKTVVTSDKRVYQFIGSDKLRGNTNFIIVLCPRNTDRIVYRIYDYQLYVSNEIRNVTNYALPSIHAFERWKFVEYQPVQGRIQIKHPTGLVDIAPNTDPIGEQTMSDFNLITGDTRIGS